PQAPMGRHPPPATIVAVGVDRRTDKAEPRKPVEAVEAVMEKRPVEGGETRPVEVGGAEAAPDMSGAEAAEVSGVEAAAPVEATHAGGCWGWRQRHRAADAGGRGKRDDRLA